MATLNEILQLSTLVTQKLIENEGLITPEISKMLEITEEGLPAKVDAYSAILDRLEMESTYLKEKANEFTKAASQLKDANIRLKARMKEAMIQHGLLELKGKDERFVISPSRSAVEITDSKMIPAKYKTQRTVVEEVIDKDAIRASLERGEPIGGVELRPVFALKRFVNKGN